MTDRDDIDRLVRTFFEAFATGEGCDERLDALPGLFAPGAVVVRVLDGTSTTYDVAGFVGPRRELLTSGALTAFREWETSSRTELYGDIAHRWSGYAKEWSEGGTQRTGEGTKSLQLLRARGTWLISSLIWADAPPR